MLEAHTAGIDLLFLWRLSSTRIKARFQALIVPCYLARVNHSRGKKHGEAQWQKHHWTAMDAQRGAWKHDKASIVKSDGKKMISIEIPRKPTDGQENIADTWTATRRSTISYTPPWHQRHRCESTITLACNGRGPSSWTYERKNRFRTLFENSRTSSTRTRTTEFLVLVEERENEAKDHSMKNCDQN